jgi:hypothetical protein
MTETFTDSLRRRLREHALICPTCGQSTEAGGIRALAKRSGVTHTTLWRFMRGSDVTGTTIDAIVKFLGGPV